VIKLFTLGFLFSYAVERVLETFWKRSKLHGKIVAPYSLPLIVSAYVSFYLAIFWDWSQMSEVQFSWWFVSIGIAMVIASTVGRHWAISTLGVYHSIHIEIREQHDLIESGPYQYTRNPYYLSNIVEAIGLPLIVNSKLAALIVLLVYLPLLFHRIVLEEKALEDKFNGKFIDYRARLPTLIPRLSRSRRRR